MNLNNHPPIGRPSGWRLGSVIAVHGAAAGCFAIWRPRGPESLLNLPEPVWVVWAVHFFTQASLLGCWAAVSRQALLTRAGALLAGLSVLTFFVTYGLDLLDFATEFAIGMVFVAGFTLGAFWIGRIQWLGAWEMEHAPRARPRIRFSIRDLMICTLLVAVLLVAARALRHFPWTWVAATAGTAGSLALLTLAAAWATLGRRRPFGRIAVYLAAVVAIFLIHVYVSSQISLIHFTTLLMTRHSIFVFASLLALRFCGIRFA